MREELHKFVRTEPLFLCLKNLLTVFTHVVVNDDNWPFNRFSGLCNSHDFRLYKYEHLSRCMHIFFGMIPLDLKKGITLLFRISLFTLIDELEVISKLQSSN